MTRLKEAWGNWLGPVIYSLFLTAGILAAAFENQKELKQQR